MLVLKSKMDIRFMKKVWKNQYFCKREDGSDFVAAVWPGDTHFPDVLNADARKWFGDQYRFLDRAGN